MTTASGQTVLVVDDRRDVAATLAEMCRAEGYAAAIAEEGVDIRTLVERYRPAALIIDVMMPDQDGYEALKEIAAFDPALPVLLITGYGDTWLRMGATLGRAHGLRMLETAAKPVRTETVRQFLAKIPAS
ncbi:MAG TPA: response regulator [Acetobacteraceae bacterium]